jgi:hypothetical protein
MNFLSLFTAATQLFFSCSGDYTGDWSPERPGATVTHETYKDTASLMLDQTDQTIIFKTSKNNYSYQRDKYDMKNKKGKSCDEIKREAQISRMPLPHACGDVWSDETSLSFSYKYEFNEPDRGYQNIDTITGDLNRITGKLKAKIWIANTQNHEHTGWAKGEWDMTCKKVDKPLF